MNHRFSLFLAALATTTAITAQTNGSNSPYSRYGFGLTNDRTGAAATGMAGAGLGLRSNLEVNAQNPASYSAVDSLTFLFDIGMSFQNGNFHENGRKVNARNTSIDYVTVGFRATKNLGISLGLLPFSTIGYNMNSQDRLSTSTGEVTKTETYSGDGGLHTAYAGLGWRPFKPLSIGINAGYLWGDMTHTVLASFSDATMSARRRQYTADIHSYQLDFGLQYEQRIDRKNSFVLGLIYGLGHDISSRADFYDQVGTSNSYSGDTVSCHNAYQLPHSFGAGLVWNHDDRLRVAFDYKYRLWKDVKAPVAGQDASGNYTYTAQKGLFKNRSQIALGAEYIPNPLSYKWRDHVVYRAGLSYSTPYVKINGNDGPKNIAASLGVGIPIVNPLHSNRPINLNVGLQYERVQPSASTALKENYLRLTLGITFCETWFLKWKAR